MFSAFHGVYVDENKDYRSVHYIIAPDGDEGPRVEIQVRTLFEEGWSEINHRLLYKIKPTELNVFVRDASMILSALAGDCDTLGELMNKVSQYGTPNKGATGATSGLGLNADALHDSKPQAATGTVAGGRSLIDVLEEFLKGQ
jgi:hypothetical protein